MPAPDRKRPLAASYWVPGDCIVAGQYPGSTNPSDALQKISALLDAGITAFIDLTEEDELIAYDDLLREESARRNIATSYLRIPIPDVSIPGPGVMNQVLDAIDSALAEGRVAYVHCRGGIGRTGTVVGCHLIERGMAPGEALKTVQGLFEQYGRAIPPLQSPETKAQRAFVERWSPRRTGREKAQ